MEAARSYYHITRRHNPEDLYSNLYHSKNLKCHIEYSLY